MGVTDGGAIALTLHRLLKLSLNDLVVKYVYRLHSGGDCVILVGFKKTMKVICVFNTVFFLVHDF